MNPVKVATLQTNGLSFELRLTLSHTLAAAISW